MDSSKGECQQPTRSPGRPAKVKPPATEALVHAATSADCKRGNAQINVCIYIYIYIITHIGMNR